MQWLKIPIVHAVQCLVDQTYILGTVGVYLLEVQVFDTLQLFTVHCTLYSTLLVHQDKFRLGYKTSVKSVLCFVQ